MRVESYKISPQVVNGQPKPSNWIQTLLIRLYAAALKLYPQPFRAAFADEMLAVFAMTLREARHPFALLTLIWREGIEFPMNLFRIYQRPPYLTTPLRVWRARQVIRWSSLTLSVFIWYGLINLISHQTVSVYGAAFYLLLSLTLLGMALAWRWERIGGLLTMACGTGLGIYLIWYMAYFRPVEISLIGLTLAGTLWALPFIAFGMLFYHISRYSNAGLQPQSVPVEVESL